MDYIDKHIGYRCLYPLTGQVFISRHVVFDEIILPFKVSDKYKPNSLELMVTTFNEWINSTCLPHIDSASPTSSSTYIDEAPVLDIPLSKPTIL